MPKKNHTRSVTSSSAKTGLGVVFLTIFIDLVGFSIIFPLFPDMLDYYIGKEANGEGFLSKILSRIPDQPLAAGLDVPDSSLWGILGSLIRCFNLFSLRFGADFQTDRQTSSPSIHCSLNGSWLSNLGVFWKLLAVGSVEGYSWYRKR